MSYIMKPTTTPKLVLVLLLVVSIFSSVESYSSRIVGGKKTKFGVYPYFGEQCNICLSTVRTNDKIR